MASEINIALSLWGQDREIRLTQLQGGEYHLYVDSFFQGMIKKQEGKMIFHCISRCDLTRDDLQGLLDSLQGS